MQQQARGIQNFFSLAEPAPSTLVRLTESELAAVAGGQGPAITVLDHTNSCNFPAAGAPAPPANQIQILACLVNQPDTYQLDPNPSLAAQGGLGALFGNESNPIYTYIEIGLTFLVGIGEAFLISFAVKQVAALSQQHAQQEVNKFYEAEVCGSKLRSGLHAHTVTRLNPSGPPLHAHSLESGIAQAHAVKPHEVGSCSLEFEEEVVESTNIENSVEATSSEGLEAAAEALETLAITEEVVEGITEGIDTLEAIIGLFP